MPHHSFPSAASKETDQLADTSPDERVQPGSEWNKAPDELLALSSDPVRRRIWLLYVAQQRFPIDQAIEWARIAEDFLSGATSSPRRAEISARASSASVEASRRAQRGGSRRETILQLIKENPDGLTRREILELLQAKGNKAAEASVSNVLHALLKRKEVIRHERKYRVAEEQAR